MERLDFEKELISRPLSGAGFSERLRKRIEEAIDANENVRKPRTFAIASFCSVLFLAALVFGLVKYDDPSDHLYHAAQQTSDAVVETLSASSAHPVTTEVRSGLLIGLRTDGPVSDYRTLYIAPKQERLQVAAEGKGVLVPYKQQFWNVDFVKTSSDGDQYVVTYPAQTGLFESPVKLIESADNTVHREELLFVGNEYVSVIETNLSANPASDTGSAKRVWTTKIPLLDARSSPLRAANRNDLKKFTLNDVFGTNAKDPDYETDGWAVGRKQGRWVPLVAYNNGMPNMTLRDVNAVLPESVANYDQLCCSWAEIAAKQPQAIDAFSSPSGDMTVVLTNDRILVYPGSPFRSAQPVLAVNLNRNEKVIMAQWATGRYVDEWAEKTKQILQSQ